MTAQLLFDPGVLGDDVIFVVISSRIGSPLSFLFSFLLVSLIVGNKIFFSALFEVAAHDQMIPRESAGLKFSSDVFCQPWSGTVTDVGSDCCRWPAET